MHRPAWTRVLITLWGIWFTTALTEPAGLFACAMHSGLAAPSAVGGMGMPVQMQMAMPVPIAAHGEHPPHAVVAAGLTAGATANHDHAAMRAQGSQRATAVGGDQSPMVVGVAASTAIPEHTPQHDCCTCIGQCGVTAVVAAPVRAIELTVATIDAVAPPAFTHRAHMSLARAHALPFANGPPLALL